MKKFTPPHREKEITLYMLTEALVMLHIGLPELVELVHTTLYALFTSPATLFIGREYEPRQVSHYISIDKILDNLTETPTFMLVIAQECCPYIQKYINRDGGETNIYLTITEPGRKTSANFLVPPRRYAEPLDQLFKRALAHIDYEYSLNNNVGISSNLVLT